MRSTVDSWYRWLGVVSLLAASIAIGACGSASPTPDSGAAGGTPAAQPAPAAPSLEMGGAKSVTRFFITSRGLGTGGNLGGLAGADAHCQALADAEGSGDHTWRAYLSTSGGDGRTAVHARDRIGKGPWYNAEGLLVAENVDQLHGDAGRIDKQTALTERLDPVNGVGESPNRHDILTGSRRGGTAFTGNEDLTCGDWTSGDAGRAQVGHHDRTGQGEAARSWNSAHATSGCSQHALERTGGAGLFYCFAID